MRRRGAGATEKPCLKPPAGEIPTPAAGATRLCPFVPAVYLPVFFPPGQLFPTGKPAEMPRGFASGEEVVWRSFVRLEISGLAQKGLSWCQLKEKQTKNIQSSN